MRYEYWSSLTEAALRDYDIAAANLEAAVGLPGAVDLDCEGCLAKLDEWAELVRNGIRTNWKRRSRGEYCDYTGNQFRVLVMVTILQRDLGVHYNPYCMTGEYDATDACDHFIHGPLYGHGGTCSSLPFLYIAIGRRIGFPLFLVRAKEHLFVRWDGDGERFNIEATSRGFNKYDDLHYRRSPRSLSDREIAQHGYLQDLTRRQELADIFFQRGRCWVDSLKFDKAVKAMYFAAKLDPFHRGSWIASSMEFKIFERMKTIPASLPWKARVERCGHAPRSAEEAWGIQAAQEDLMRIFAVYERRNASL